MGDPGISSESSIKIGFPVFAPGVQQLRTVLGISQLDYALWVRGCGQNRLGSGLVSGIGDEVLCFEFG